MVASSSHVGQSVRAEQDDVAARESATLDGDSRTVRSGRANRVHQDVLQIPCAGGHIGERRHLRAREVEGVVARQPQQLAVAVQIGARMSDVRKKQFAASADDRRQGGPQSRRARPGSLAERCVYAPVEPLDSVDDLARDRLVDSHVPSAE